MKSELTEQIQYYKANWHRCAIGWNFLHLLLASTATVSSVVVATFSTEMGDSLTKAFAFMAAISVGLISTFDLSARRKNYRNAWRHLNQRYLIFISGGCSEKDLIRAYGKGERTIGHYVTKVEEDSKNGDNKNV